MIQRVALISGLLISASCTVLHHLSIPSHILRVPQEEVNYNFAYDVNDVNTGDIKSQSETRRGDVVLGQYSLLQPDGVRRTVEYRADDNTGFIATVNNNGRPVEQNRDQTDITSAAPREEEQINQITNQVRIPVTVPTTPTIARSVVLQSRPNTYEPWISTILHV